MVDRICAASRAENRAAGQRLAAIGELDLLRAREHDACERWSIDTVEAVSAEVAAALRISQGLASNFLYYARAMRTRLPQVGALLLAGDIDYWTFQTIVYRTDLISDPDLMAAVDAELAVKAPRWPGLTRARLAGHVDRIVARVDRDAVRQRRQSRVNDREIVIWGDVDGVSEIGGRLFTTDAYALDVRLEALANTVCANDPRSREQRRADALGALTGGAERLDCRCGQPDCPAASTPATRPALIHVIAEQATVDGTGQQPGSLIGADALIPAELIAELAGTAKLQPLFHPTDTPPEKGYTPSRALADFVRCRDLTCRFPGCDEPAIGCDLDHTIAFGDGGATHASNLKTLCSKHHLIKTFWGWRDQQLADGTVIWRSPSGQTYVTTPGSALLFPSLCAPTLELDPPDPARADRCGERTAMMPTRRRTRAQNRASRIAGERRQNREAREARRLAREAAWSGPAPPGSDDEPPPF